MFEGHELCKLEDNWAFDMTTFIGYYVKLDNDNKVKKFDKAFMAIRDNQTGTYNFDSLMRVPVRILKRAASVIQLYRREALLENVY